MTTLAAPERTAAELLEIPLDQLHASKDNPRRNVGDVVELAMSIKSMGIIEPLIVTPNGNGYIVVAGHRRLAGAELAALDTVPCIVRDLDDQERLAAMLVENLQRADLAPLEEAGAFRRLVDEFGMTQRTLSEKVGRSQGHISKRLALLDLPKKIQAELDSGGITIADAVELSKLSAMPKRLEAAFKQGKLWRGQFARAVEDELDEIELLAKIAAATEELKQAGTKVVAYKNGSSGYPELPKGAVELDGWDARQLNLTVANHKNQPCHAGAVNPRDGHVVYVCTKPATHEGKTLETPADEKEKARKEREAEKRAQLRAREKNIQLGALLEAKLVAPKIDARNMRLLVDLLLLHEIANRGLRYVDEASQTVITKRDGTVSRIAHVEGLDGRALLDKKLAAATTAEEIMGALLQALIAAKHADTKAVPPSQRFGSVRGIGGQYSTGSQHIIKPLEAIAKAAGVGKTKPPAKTVN